MLFKCQQTRSFIQYNEFCLLFFTNCQYLLYLYSSTSMPICIEADAIGIIIIVQSILGMCNYIRNSCGKTPIFTVFIVDLPVEK